MGTDKLSSDYWTLGVDSILKELATSKEGLTSVEADKKITIHGYNDYDKEHKFSAFRIFWNQVKSPLTIILFVAAIISGVTGDKTDTFIVLVILLGSTGIGFWREYSANTALSALQDRIKLRCSVMRDGVVKLVHARELVPGDIIVLSAGVLIPADAVVIEADDLFLDQAIVTGESFPVEKTVSMTGVAAGVSFSDRSNFLFQGTSVRSGTGSAVVVKTGRGTVYGGIVKNLAVKPPETDFDRGLKKFGTLLLSIMLIILIVAFFASSLLGHHASESLMFAVALAVGLSPELLPAILTVNLARSSTALAKQGVLVRRLNAIENLGSMNVICTDKTGTITEGVIDLHGSFDFNGAASTYVGHLAYANAELQKGLPNPLDQAILRHGDANGQQWERLGEIPYDFVRKRLTVVVRGKTGVMFITKGALDRVLSICDVTASGQPIADVRGTIDSLFQAWSQNGIRVLGVASKELPEKEAYDASDEEGFCFQGFITFVDRPKAGVDQVIKRLKELAVGIKVITGDNRLVACYVAKEVGIDTSNVVTGEQLDELRDEALWAMVEDVQVFAQVDPNQKERIIHALRKRGRVVGYMGDGINDAPAMHAADTSISVETAADVAKATADFVLTESNLAIVASGIEEGRKTFANTFKYILLDASANFGNMVSMATASLMLPFLPLLPGQILLNNFLADIPAFGLADDEVDEEMLSKPRSWDMGFVRRFMIEFGLLSSVFDFLTFAVLLFVFHASVDLFRTAWFAESLLTQLVAIFTLRTRRRFYRSRPATLLIFGSLAVAVVGLLLPYSPLGSWFGFVALPLPVLATILFLAAVYVAGTECIKGYFYKSADKRAMTTQRTSVG